MGFSIAADGLLETDNGLACVVSAEYIASRDEDIGAGPGALRDGVAVDSTINLEALGRSQLASDSDYLVQHIVLPVL